MPACKSCGAPIRWARSVNDKPILLDAEPHEQGNLELSGGVARYVTPDLNAIETRYRSHFATCPNADEHRKPRKPRRKEAR